MTLLMATMSWSFTGAPPNEGDHAHRAQSFVTAQPPWLSPAVVVDV